MTFIYTTRKMFPSAKALARSLEVKLNSHVRVTANQGTTLKGPAIRWGTYAPCLVDQINNADLIFRASQKANFSKAMVENGIDCVEIESGTPERFPVVIRRTLTGFGGAGISICANKIEWLSYLGKYWSYYRNFRPELGVHIFKGKILKVFKKVRDPNLPEEAYPIRNATRGYHFSLVELENYPKLIPFVEKFYKVFPIMMGRMDVGWDFENKMYRVIEFNTAPCLTNNPDTLESYTNSLLEVL